MTTFNDGTDDYTPIVVNGFEAARASRTFVHSIIGTNSPAIALQPSDLRSGTLTTLWPTLTDAEEFEGALAAGAVWTVSDGTTPEVNMSFVVSGDVGIQLDPDSLVLGIVRVEFQEVAA
jgi:hypothetical protein